jgi:hypothetical protein
VILRAPIKESAMRNEDRGRWTRLVADFGSADLSQRQFAQERGIPLSNLRYWLYKLRNESRPLTTEQPEQPAAAPEQPPSPRPSRLLPVRVIGSAAKPRSDAMLELATASGAVLRFPVGTDVSYLRQVVAALP